MALPNTIYPIPPNHPFPMPNSSAMTLQSQHPSPQQRSTPNSPLYSHLDPAPMLAFPLYHPSLLAFGPSRIALTGHGHDHPLPQPMMRDHTWHSTMSAPTPQVFRSDARAPNIEPRKGTTAAHKHFPPIPANQPISTHAQLTSTDHPTNLGRVSTHPYTRLSFRKRTRPAADYTPDIQLIQARCLADGGDPEAVNLLPSIFKDDISIKALTRRMTRDEARGYNDGAQGQVFQVVLRVDKDKRHHCRLCAIDANEGGWRCAKDVLRHLKRDHFGLGTRCDRCGKIAYTTGELTRHRCVHQQVSNPAAGSTGA